MGFIFFPNDIATGRKSICIGGDPDTGKREYLDGVVLRCRDFSDFVGIICLGMLEFAPWPDGSCLLEPHLRHLKHRAPEDGRIEQTSVLIVILR